MVASRQFDRFHFVEIVEASRTRHLPSWTPGHQDSLTNRHESRRNAGRLLEGQKEKARKRSRSSQGVNSRRVTESPSPKLQLQPGAS